MIFPKQLKRYYELLEKECRNAGIIAGKSGRHMKFPYTLSAKIAQYPVFFYMKNNWIWMYWPVGIFGSFFVFFKIHRLVNSPSNKKSWAEVQRRNAEKEKEKHH